MSGGGIDKYAHKFLYVERWLNPHLQNKMWRKGWVVYDTENHRNEQTGITKLYFVYRYKGLEEEHTT